MVRVLRLLIDGKRQDLRHGGARRPGRQREGETTGPRRAISRALVFPLGFLLLGLGFVGILIDGERHALHDVIAGTDRRLRVERRCAAAALPGPR